MNVRPFRHCLRFCSVRLRFAKQIIGLQIYYILAGMTIAAKNATAMNLCRRRVAFRISRICLQCRGGFIIGGLVDARDT